MEKRKMELNFYKEWWFGYGFGDGDGSGYGFWSGYGSGSVYGDGYGSGSGSVYGDGYGSGYGYGKQKIILKKEYAMKAYHFIKKINGEYITRNSKTFQKGEELFEEKIKLCECGLHASFTIQDASKYAPNNSVLTRVLVWGEMYIDKDKLVAQYRMILEEINQ
jgi:hypothetical protein